MEIEKVFIPKETESKFKTIFKTLISDYYKYVIEREKEICSFGIFTDSDISGFVISFNTQSGMEKILESGIKWNKENPDNKFKIDSDKWWMPEWKSDSVKEGFFDKDDRYNLLAGIMDELRKKSNWDFDDTKNTFAIYKREMFDSICDALKELKEEKLFKNISKDFFLLVQESDNGIYDERAVSLKKIMSKKQFEEYRKYNEG